MITVNTILSEFQSLKARINEYYQLIAEEVNDDATLDDLTSTSKTAEFNLWMYIYAAMTVIANSLWEERKAEIQAIADAAIPGTEKWFQKELLKFQYDDTLSFDETTAKYFYPVIDTDKQIIKRCAVVSNGGLTQVKVAKESAGIPVPLSAPELTAFAAYLRQIQWAGANVAAPISLASDKLNAPITIYYNGTVSLDTLKPLVEAAFNSYLAALPFNGEYKITAHQDALQLVEDVNDVVMGVVQAKPDAGSYANVNRVYYPVAGYIEKDPAIDFDDMITYVAQ